MEQLTTNQGYLTQTDTDNKPMIDPVYYKNTILDLIHRYIEDSQADPYKPTIDPDKLTNNHMIAICNYINQALFTNHKQRYITDKRCNIPYTEYNISTLYQLYIDIMQEFGCLPSFYGFSRLTGIDEDVTKKYLTRSCSEIVNCRREMLRNMLADDKTGRIVLANNDASFGLEYEKKQSLERETIRQGLSVGELPKFE